MGRIRKNWNQARTAVSGFLGGSVSGWEDSFYGGYYNVLWDYPEITVPFNLDWKLRTGTDMNTLTFYTYQKLIKIFLLKVKEHNGIDYFIKDATFIEKLDILGRKTIRATIHPVNVRNTLDRVISEETELKNLFEHYSDIITSTEFWYDAKPNGGKGAGNGDPDDDQRSQTQTSGVGSDQMRKVMEIMKNELDTVSKNEYRYNWGSSNDQQVTFRVMDKRKPISFTANQQLSANQLIEMLDISFDPEKDTIYSLRAGKLDVRKIAEIPAGNFNVYQKEEENITTRPFSVCMLMDESGSMEGSRTTYMMETIKVLFNTFSRIMPPEKIFVYGHSTSRDEGNPEIRVYNDRYNHIFEETINGLPDNLHAGTPCVPVVQAVYDKVRSFTNDNIIFLYACDGTPDGGSESIKKLKQIIEKCRRDGFVTIGIGIQSYHVKAIYNYTTVITELDQMVKRVSMIVNHVVKTEFQN